MYHKGALWRPPCTPSLWSGRCPPSPGVHLDAGYDWSLTAGAGLAKDGGQIAARRVPAPIQAGRPWVIERTNARGNQCGKLRWCTERRLVVEFWLTPPSSVAGSSAAPDQLPLAAPRVDDHDVVLGTPFL